MRFWPTSLLLLGICLFSSQVAYGQLDICNRSTVSIDIAIGYPENGEWFSQGWWTRAPGQCVRVLGGALANRNYYVRAEEVNGPRRWESSAESRDFCVTRAAFKLKLSRAFSCSMDPSVEPWSRSFIRIDVGNNTFYTDNLTCTDCPPAPARPTPIPPPQPSTDKPDWQKHIDWASRNSNAGGEVNCVGDYLVSYPECYASGGRSCIIGKARQSARDNNCSWAMYLATLTQCHNDQAANTIKAAGEYAVCQYLGPPTPPKVSAPPAARPTSPWPGQPSRSPSSPPAVAHTRISVTVVNESPFPNTYEIHDNVCNTDRTLPMAAHARSSISLCSSGVSTNGYASFKSRFVGNKIWNNFDLINAGETRILN
jgi:uncharacterized membrane protein